MVKALSNLYKISSLLSLFLAFYGWGIWIDADADAPFKIAAGSVYFMFLSYIYWAAASRLDEVRKGKPCSK